MRQVEKDSYKCLLRQNKLPIILLRDGSNGMARPALERNSYERASGPKAQRKRARLASGSKEVLGEATDPGCTSAISQALDGPEPKIMAKTREAIYSKGRSSRM